MAKIPKTPGKPGRPSKLSPAQWFEISQRRAKGDSYAKIAKDYDASESTIREGVVAEEIRVKMVAEQMMSAELAFHALPISAQVNTQVLLNRLRSISHHLAGAAEYGAATAHRLSQIANNQIEQLDPDASSDGEHAGNMKILRNQVAFTTAANEAAKIGLNLLAANKDMVIKAADEEKDITPNNETMPTDPIAASKAYQRLIGG